MIGYSNKYTGEDIPPRHWTDYPFKDAPFINGAFSAWLVIVLSKFTLWVFG